MSETESVELLDAPASETTSSDDAPVKQWSHTMRFTHPNNSGTGSQLSFSVSPPRKDSEGKYRNGCLWVNLEKQIAGTKHGDKRMFDYENTVGFKLNSVEVGRLLEVLWGEVKEVGTEPRKEGDKFMPGLVHKFGTGQSNLYFAMNDNKSVSVKVAVKGGQTIAFTVFASGERTVLTDYFQRALSKMEPV